MVGITLDKAVSMPARSHPQGVTMQEQQVVGGTRPLSKETQATCEVELTEEELSQVGGGHTSAGPGVARF